MSVSRPLAAGASMGILLAMAGYHPLSHFMFIAAGVSILMSMEAERPGYLHSLPSVLVISLAAMALSPVICGDLLYGVSIVVGLSSSLLLDSLNGSLYVWKRGAVWLSVMPDKRWSGHGDAVVSLVCGVLLVGMVVLG